MWRPSTFLSRPLSISCLFVRARTRFLARAASPSFDFLRPFVFRSPPCPLFHCPLPYCHLCRCFATHSNHDCMKKSTQTAKQKRMHLWVNIKANIVRYIKTTCVLHAVYTKARARARAYKGMYAMSYTKLIGSLKVLRGCTRGNYISTFIYYARPASSTGGGTDNNDLKTSRRYLAATFSNKMYDAISLCRENPRVRVL